MCFCTSQIWKENNIKFSAERDSACVDVVHCCKGFTHGKCNRCLFHVAQSMCEMKLDLWQCMCVGSISSIISIWSFASVVVVYITGFRCVLCGLTLSQDVHLWSILDLKAGWCWYFTKKAAEKKRKTQKSQCSVAPKYAWILISPWVVSSGMLK